MKNKLEINKEKALKCISEFTIKCNNVVSAVHSDIAIDAVKLASKPDWYYPNKGEFPEKSMMILSNKGEILFYESNGDNGGGGYFWDYEYTDRIDDPTAWTYIPPHNNEM